MKQNAMVKAANTQPGAALEKATEAARDFIRHAKAANTVRAYESDWRHFRAWCQGHGLAFLPAAPETVALYVSDLAGNRSHKTSTLTRRLSAISQAHQLADVESPTTSAKVRTVMAGIRRTNGTAYTSKAPALTVDIRAMVAQLPDGLLGVRDRALLLVGFAGAFRRSELVGLDAADLETTTEGLVATIRRSKTDQEGEGRKIGIPRGTNPATCPVTAMQHWLDSGRITSGPVFRPVNRHSQVRQNRLSGYAVALVVKRYARSAGLDADRFAGHSLRAGLATSAAANGVHEREIMRQTGHKSLPVLRRYIRAGELFRGNAAGSVGL